MQLYDDIMIKSISSVVEKHDDNKFDYICAKRKGYGIVFCTGGSGIFTFNGKKYGIKPGTVIVLDSGDRYRVRAGESGFSYITDSFMLAEDIKLSDCGVAKVIDTKDNPTIINKAKNMLYVWNNRQDCFVMETRIMMEGILLELLRLSKQLSISRTYGLRVMPAVDYISQNYDKKITNEKLAQVCNMSVTHFRRVFKEELEITPMQYHEKVRMYWAVTFLESRMFTVSEISEKLGYSDVYYFSNAFKRHTGNTPTYYKNK